MKAVEMLRWAAFVTLTFAAMLAVALFARPRRDRRPGADGRR